MESNHNHVCCPVHKVQLEFFTRCSTRFRFAYGTVVPRGAARSMRPEWKVVSFFTRQRNTMSSSPCPALPALLCPASPHFVSPHLAPSRPDFSAELAKTCNFRYWKKANLPSGGAKSRRASRVTYLPRWAPWKTVWEWPLLPLLASNLPRSTPSEPNELNSTV